MYCRAYLKWHAAEKIWLKRDQGYKDNHPYEDPDLIYPGVKALSKPLPDWQDWIASSPVPQFEKNVKELLTYSIHDDVNKTDGLYTVMAANWQKRHDAVVAASRTSGHFNPASVLGHFQLDATTIYLGLTRITNELAEFWNEISTGIAMLDAWDQHTEAYALGNVSYKDLVLYHDSLGLWQDALDAIKFQTLTALDGDTPRTIAQRMYKDATLYTKLLDANDNPFKDGDEDLSGVRVKVPDLDTKRVAVPGLPANTF